MRDDVCERGRRHGDGTGSGSTTRRRSAEFEVLVMGCCGANMKQLCTCLTALEKVEVELSRSWRSSSCLGIGRCPFSLCSLVKV